MLLEKSVIELNCTGKREGMYVKVSGDMIARVSFNEVAGHTTIKLKEDKVCEVFTGKKKLAGCIACGAEIAVKGAVDEVNKKLGVKMRQRVKGSSVKKVVVAKRSPQVF